MLRWLPAPINHSEQPASTLQLFKFTDSQPQDQVLDYTAVDRIKILCDASIYARDLGNEQADVANPDFLAEAARKLSQEFGMKVW